MTLEQTAVLPDSSTERKLVTLKAPLFGSDGEFIGLITHNRDVTETEALKRDLEGTRAKLQTAVDNMNDGMAMFGGDGRLIYSRNDRYRQLFPLTAHLRVPGARFEDLVPVRRDGETLINPAEADAWVTRVAALRLAEAGISQMFDGRCAAIAREEIVGDGLLLLITDITEREIESSFKSAAEYQALFVHSVAGIYRSTSGGRVLTAL